jgi:serine/threonine protein kinase
MLLADDRPMLLDFGAARRVISDMTHALTVILKPGYAPIEQYADMPGMKQGPWTDVYALAAVVYFMILKRKPPPAVSRLMEDSYEPLMRAKRRVATAPRCFKASTAASRSGPRSGRRAWRRCARRSIRERCRPSCFRRPRPPRRRRSRTCCSTSPSRRPRCPSGRPQRCPTGGAVEETVGRLSLPTDYAARFRSRLRPQQQADARLRSACWPVLCSRARLLRQPPVSRRRRQRPQWPAVAGVHGTRSASGR